MNPNEVNGSELDEAIRRSLSETEQLLKRERAGMSGREIKTQLDRIREAKGLSSKPYEKRRAYLLASAFSILQSYYQKEDQRETRLFYVSWARRLFAMCGFGVNVGIMDEIQSQMESYRAAVEPDVRTIINKLHELLGSQVFEGLWDENPAKRLKLIEERVKNLDRATSGSAPLVSGLYEARIDESESVAVTKSWFSEWVSAKANQCALQLAIGVNNLIKRKDDMVIFSEIAARAASRVQIEPEVDASAFRGDHTESGVGLHLAKYTGAISQECDARLAAVSKLLIDKTKTVELLSTGRFKGGLTVTDLSEGGLKVDLDDAREVFASFRDPVIIGSRKYLPSALGMTLEDSRLRPNVTDMISELEMGKEPESLNTNALYDLLVDKRGAAILVRPKQQELLEKLIVAGQEDLQGFVHSAPSDLNQLAFCCESLHTLYASKTVPEPAKSSCKQLFDQLVERAPAVVVHMEGLGVIKQITGPSIQDAIELVCLDYSSEASKLVIESLIEEHRKADLQKSEFGILSEYSNTIVNLKRREVAVIDAMLKKPRGDYSEELANYNRIRNLAHITGLESKLYGHLKSVTHLWGVVVFLVFFGLIAGIGNTFPDIFSKLSYSVIALLLPLISRLSKLKKLAWLNPEVQGSLATFGGTSAVILITFFSLTRGTSGTLSFLSGKESSVPMIGYVNLVLLLWLLWSGIDLAYRAARVFFKPRQEDVDLISNLTSYSSWSIIPYTLQAGFLVAVLVTNPSLVLTFFILLPLSVLTFALRRRWVLSADADEARYLRVINRDTNVRIFAAKAEALRKKQNHPISKQEVFEALEQDEVHTSRSEKIAKGAWRLLKKEGMQFTSSNELQQADFQRSAEKREGRRTRRQVGFIETPTPAYWVARLEELRNGTGKLEISNHLNGQYFSQPWYRNFLIGVFSSGPERERLLENLPDVGPTKFTRRAVEFLCDLMEKGTVRYDPTSSELHDADEVVKIVCTAVEGALSTDPSVHKRHFILADAQGNSFTIQKEIHLDQAKAARDVIFTLIRGPSQVVEKQPS